MTRGAQRAAGRRPISCSMSFVKRSSSCGVEVRLDLARGVEVVRAGGCAFQHDRVGAVQRRHRDDACTRARASAAPAAGSLRGCRCSRRGRGRYVIVPLTPLLFPRTIASATSATCFISATSCTRTMSAPFAIAMATDAAVPKTRSSTGAPPSTAPIVDLRDVPTSSGRPSARSSPRRRSISRFCSGRQPKPNPGSTIEHRCVDPGGGGDAHRLAQAVDDVADDVAATRGRAGCA